MGYGIVARVLGSPILVALMIIALIIITSVHAYPNQKQHAIGVGIGVVVWVITYPFFQKNNFQINNPNAVSPHRTLRTNNASVRNLRTSFAANRRVRVGTT